jgi:GT2 family glycosyltransferase
VSVPEALRVVILSHGGDSPAARVVDALIEEGVRPAQVVLVHNATDPSHRPPAVPDGVTVLPSGRNLGYTGGMNLGLGHAIADASAELVLLLTHDVAILPGTLAALLDAAARHPEYAILGPWLFDPVRRAVFSYGMRMDRIGGMAHMLERPADEHDGIVPADAIDGSFMLIRAEVFRRCGLFDERLFGYAEESELALRARRAGWRVGVVSSARGEQEIGVPRRPGAYSYLMARNGFNLGREAAGALGVAGGFWRAAIQLAVHGRRLADPRRPREHKRAAWASIVGTVRGSLDYFRGRWGAPPADLPGLGDVTGT